MKKTIRRALGLLLMLSSGYLIFSTLLSLVPLIRTAKAPLWLTLAVALAFLALFAAIFCVGWRLFREKKPPEENSGPEKETPAEEPPDTLPQEAGERENRDREGSGV